MVVPSLATGKPESALDPIVSSSLCSVSVMIRQNTQR